MFLVHVLQNLSQNLVKGTVLVGKRIHTNAVQFGIVARVVRLNGIKPVPDAVLTGLSQYGEVGAMVAQQIVEQPRLPGAHLRYLKQPLVDHLCFFAFES